MRYRDFGRKGFQVGELGFGAWAIGESSWGRQDDAESLGVLSRVEYRRQNECVGRGVGAS